ncbi:MAG: alpha/beta hydrolase [Erysipelotrichaceae bacterium]|nr:alpha/beta hydrolase [Erysipelotrichaceae bacterium]
MKIDVNGVTLNYEVVGNGKPLLLVHGNTMDHKCFEKGVEVLKDYYTCYMVDSRGHGESTGVDEYHYDDFVDDYIEFCNKLGLKDIYYYGLSDGGIIGVLMSSKSDIISKMVISGTNTKPDMVKKWLINIIKAMVFFTKDMRMKMMLNEPHISKETLNNVKAKTMVCAGSKDLVLEEDTRFIAENIPGAVLNIMEGEDHTSTVVKSDKFAKNCIKFFEE